MAPREASAVQTSLYCGMIGSRSTGSTTVDARDGVPTDVAAWVAP